MYAEVNRSVGSSPLLLAAAIDRIENLIAIPVVESTTSFSAKVTCGDLVSKALGNDEGGLVWEVLAPSSDDAERGVKSDIVHQVKRTHWVTSAQLHGQVDISGGCVSTIVQ